MKNRISKTKTIPVLLFLICVCGCSPQKRLAHRLEGADRVIVTNTFEHLSIIITGAEADKIVQAIAVAKKMSPLVSATPGLRLEFFKDGQRLETVNTSYRIFWIKGKPYEDTTRASEELYQKFHEEYRPQFSP